MKNLKNTFKKKRYVIAGSILGAVAGYLYYFFIGCKTGTCAITSNPVISTLYGSLMGGLFTTIVDKKEKTTN